MFFSLEEDFMIWREAFWPTVCEFFDIHSIGEDISTRQYRLELPESAEDRQIFTGEVARLNSYKNQRP